MNIEGFREQASKVGEKQAELTSFTLRLREERESLLTLAGCLGDPVSTAERIAVIDGKLQAAVNVASVLKAHSDDLKNKAAKRQEWAGTPSGRRFLLNTNQGG